MAMRCALDIMYSARWSNPYTLAPAFACSALTAFTSQSRLIRPCYHNVGRRRLVLSQSKRNLLKMKVAEDPVENRVRKELAADGVNLDELLNAGKVVSLTRKLDNLNEQCSTLVSDSAEYQEVQKKIQRVQTNLEREKRQVMQRWLKQLFVAQAIVFIGIGGVLSSDSIRGYPVPLVGQALGFWMTWLFSIPALRARKGIAKWEKSALNVAFLATPILNLLLPFLTKNCATIWAADVAVLVGCYAYYATTASQIQANSGPAGPSSQKETGRVKGILKYLDWGSWR